MTQTAMTVAPETAVARQEPTMMQLLSMAVDRGAPIETVERLAKLQREMVEYQAKLAFDKAMQQAQSGMRRVGADATNPQTRSKYVTYGKLDATLRPIYSQAGFALSFDTAQSGPDTIEVLCYVSHQDGHTRTYRVNMPADGKGAKGGDVMTKTHATGAAMSYGMRYLLKMIFNVAVGEDDDDGNLGTTVSEAELLEKLTWIENARNMQELHSIYTAAYKWAQGDQKAVRQIMTAKDARKAVLDGQR